MPKLHPIDATFQRLHGQGHGAVIPFVTAGYPDMDATAELAKRFAASGAAAIEIGFPFSDSIADGPIIQDSFHRVLERRQSVSDVFDGCGRFGSAIGVPLIAMVSFSIVQRVGVDAFVRRAADAGFGAILAPDLSAEEAPLLARAAHAAGLRHIMLVATTTPVDRMPAVLKHCSGFVYQVALSGTTGERRQVSSELRTQVAHLRSLTTLPICAGFGISTPDQVREICGYADGVIIGSGVVRRITAAMDDGRGRDQAIEDAATFVADMIAGANGARPDTPAAAAP